MSEPLDCVELTAFHLDTIVGILPSERVSAQPMQLEVRLGLPLGAIAETGDLALGVDYAAVERELTALAQEGRFWLIETFAVAAARWLLLPPTSAMARGRVHQARVTVRKPTILGGRAVPGVTIERAGVPVLAVETGDGATRTTLVATERDGAWRLELAAGAAGRVADEQGALVVAGEVTAQGVVFAAPTRVPRGCGSVLAGSQGATLLVAGVPDGAARPAAR